MTSANRLLALLWAIGLFFSQTPVCAQPESRPPNVLLILSDDQAWTDYGFMGHPVIQTPNLDRLARESAVFSRGYVPTSLCRPSLASLITGVYPHQHQVTGNDPVSVAEAGKPKYQNADYLRLNKNLIERFQSQSRLPELLAQKGYVSFQSGKWWEGEFSTGGFTNGMTYGDATRGGRHGDAGLKIGRDGLKPIYDFIESAGTKPWFVWYAPIMPHQPHNPPDRLLKKYQAGVMSVHVAKYYAMCEWFDETCGELLDHLKATGMEENTLVFYVADNGWIQNPDQPRFDERSKRSPYDGGIRTPIMIRWPGHIAPEEYPDRLTSSLDFVPTVCVAAGVPIDEKLPGIDLLRVSNQNGISQRDTLFGEIFDHDLHDLDDPEKSLLFRWCIEGNWKLIQSHTDQSLQLFDLAGDPHEKMNLAEQHADVAKRLLAKIEAWYPAKKSR